MFTVPSILGIVLFVAIKFAGYRYAGQWLNHLYSNPALTNPNIFGAVRTILGIAIGSAFGYAIAMMDIRYHVLSWYALILPCRFLEWLFILWIFYERKVVSMDKVRWLKFSLYGTLWSYALDVVTAFVLILVPGAIISEC